jgi:hypothetical protein
MDEPVFRLKEKYRLKKQGYRNGKYKSRTGNSHGPTPKPANSKEGKSLAPPRRVYLGAATPGKEMVKL